MFCPVCESEYRPGIERCAVCDVPLVHDLTASRRPPRGGSPRGGPMVPYCGFLGLAEAREARDLLRRQAIRSEIVIQEAPDSALDEPLREEFWLRIFPADLPAASTILGYDEAEEAPADDAFQCSACGASVPADASSCPQCGERFEA